MPPAHNPFASKAIRANEENIGVVGKSYPTSLYSDAVSRYPTLFFFLSLILPVVFTFLAMGSLTEVDVSIQGFEASPHESTTSATIITDAISSWVSLISGSSALQGQLTTTGPRSKQKFRQELRFAVDLVALDAYCSKNPSIANYCWAQANMLLDTNLRYVQRVEQLIFSSSRFRAICFTNNLKYGTPQPSTPSCVPFNSITQFFYPGPFIYASNGEVQWELSGVGTVYQYPYDDVLNRIFTVPNVEWFLDTNFSTLNRFSRTVRTQIILGTPVSTILGDVDGTRELVNFINNLQKELSHPYIRFSYGGDQVEDAKMIRAIARDSWKLAIVLLIIVAVAFAHTRTFVVSVCVLLHVVLVYMASWGLYIKGYAPHDANDTGDRKDSMPLLSSVSILVVVSFTLHGALAFYDTFTHSGIMATTGRQNFLSISQRIAFCMRRSSMGTTIANGIAILICCASLSSAFRSVRDFSVMMIFTLLFNMYCCWTLLPSYILWHHFHFSRRRRLAQKKREIRREQTDGLRRSAGMARLMQDVQSSLLPGEEVYIAAMEKEGMLETLETERQRTMVENGARALVSDARKEMDNLIAVIKKSREEQNTHTARSATTTNEEAAAMSGRGVKRSEGDDEEGPSAPGFDERAFVDVGDNQQLAQSRRYVSDRLVNVVDIVHVPEDLTLRSVENLQLISQLSDEFQNGVQPVTNDEAPWEPPQLGRRLLTVPQHFPTAQDAATFFEFWEKTALQVGMDSLKLRARRAIASSNPDAVDANNANALVLTHELQPIVPLAAFQWACTHDPTWFVSEVHDQESSSRQARGGRPPTDGHRDGGERPAFHVERNQGGRVSNKAQRAVKPDANYKGFFSRMRHRWRVRKTEERAYCCGMLGKRVNETQEERDARILAQVARPEGYGRAERFIINFLAPFINKFRFVFLCLFVVLLGVAIGVSTLVKGAGVPFTLLAETEEATLYNRLGYAYGEQQIKNCDFCGLYYQAQTAYRHPSWLDVSVCSLQGRSQQLYQFLDSCMVCGGSNGCLGCNNQPNSGYVTTSCGGCSNNENECKACYSYQQCSWCQMHGQGGAGSGWGDCSKKCNTTVCPTGRGVCSPYTGSCNCINNRNMGFQGELCSSCAPGWVPYLPTCSVECTAFSSYNGCTCEDFKCQFCPDGKWGYNCEQPTMMCVHGTQRPGGSLICDCDAGWEDGNLCKYHRNCSYRGILLNATESPVPCGCAGNWMGPDCNLCGCRNGGTCNADGTCNCLPAFVGPQCQVCASSCVTRGTCPNSIPLTQYNLRSCIVANCPLTDVDTNTVCSACSTISWSTSGNCSAFLSQVTCNADLACFWLAGRCVNETNPARGVNASEGTCRCKGAWTGQYCDVCGGPRGSTCTRSGDVVACNKFVYTDAAAAPAVDACGVCGGNGNCRGCDGLPNSGKRYDSCGVCGGNDACLAAEGAAPVEVTFFFDTTGHHNFTQVLVGIRDACALLSRYGSESVASSPFASSAILSGSSSWFISFTCFVGDYVNASPDIGSVTPATLYAAALQAGRLADTGFETVWSIMNLDFVVVRATTTKLTTASNDELYSVYEDMLALAGRMSVVSGLSVRQTSPVYKNVVSAHVSVESVRFTAGVGIALLFGTVSCVFGSIRLGFFTALMATFVLCATLAGAATQGWDLDSVMQVLVATIVCVAAEHAVHLLDGYQDFLQATQSHMFAVATTRMHAFRGALTRTGLSIFSSAVAVILVCLPYLSSDVQPYRRAAQVIISIHLTALIGALFLGAKLCVWGPLLIFRELGVTIVMCCVCCTCAGLAVLIIYLAGGVMGPAGSRIP